MRTTVLVLLDTQLDCGARGDRGQQGKVNVLLWRPQKGGMVGSEDRLSGRH